MAQVGFYDIYVSRKIRKKLLKTLTSPVAPVRLDVPVQHKYSGFNVQPSPHTYYH